MNSSTNTNQLISIVIVNWNAGNQLLDVVNRIKSFHRDLVEAVIIVDNASVDNSLELVEAVTELPFEIKIIRNTQNVGFGKACNQGARLVTSSFLLFLNPDTRLFDNSLSVPFDYMQNPLHADVGVTGIMLIDEDNHIGRSCARFPTLLGFFLQALGLNRLPSLQQYSLHMADWSHDETRQVDHVLGAFYLMRSELFNKINGFDEDFFVYLEDLDLSLRINQQSYKSMYLADAQAFHAGGGTSRQVKVHRLFYSLRSRLIYGFKHFARWQAWTLVLLTMGVEWLPRCVLAIFTSGWEGVSNTCRAYAMLWGDLGNTLKKQRR